MLLSMNDVSFLEIIISSCSLKVGISQSCREKFTFFLDEGFQKIHSFRMILTCFSTSVQVSAVQSKLIVVLSLFFYFVILSDLHYVDENVHLGNMGFYLLGNFRLILRVYDTSSPNGQATPKQMRKRKWCRSIGYLYYPIYLPHQAKVIFWVQNPFCRDIASKIAFAFALVWLDHNNSSLGPNC